MLTDDFYTKLVPLNNLLDITDSKNFVSVPESWYIIITDIADSTQAIASGRYKEINLLGAASIVAILNISKDIDIPFIFGGDGASILVPSSLLKQSKQALVATQQIARAQFNLNLRVGIVPVSAAVEAGYEIKIAKLKLSENYSQAIITGGGLVYAIDFIKDYGIPDIYQLKRQNNPVGANFAGLECRWKDIPSRHGEVVSLHVLAIGSFRQRNNQVYREVLEKIQEIYGDSNNFHPVTVRQLHLSFSQRNLGPEIKLRTQPINSLEKTLALTKLRLENLLGVLFMQFKLKLNQVNWGTYKRDVIASTDYQKFDDMLRMIISGNTSQSSRLTHYLEQRYREGDLVYGLHISNRVLMTCLVFERNGRQVHFIDGADGGLAIAAQSLKERMLRKALNWKTFLKMMRLRRSGDLI